MSGLQIKPKTWLFNGVGMDADATSAVQESHQVQNVTIYIWWENGTTPVGEVELWARFNPKSERVAVYKQLTLSSTLTVSGTSGSLVLNLTEPLSEWYLMYDRTSGDGDLYATWEGKSRG